MRYVLLPLTICALLLIIALPTAAQTATPTPPPTPFYVATPAHDLFVWDENPNTNYSTSTAIYYRTSPSLSDLIAYIYPDIQNNEGINSAVLWVYFWNRTPQPVMVNQSWPVDNTVTWNNRPVSIGVIDVVTPTLGWFSFDITETVQKGRSVRLEQAAPPNNNQTFMTSIENSLAPYVVYSYYPTATPLATATPSAAVELVELPSGNLAAVQMSATAGELFISGVLLVVLFVLLWPAIGKIAEMNSKR